MLRVLFFIETIDGGGAEKVLRNLVNNMDQNRFNITVATVYPCNYKEYLKSGINYQCLYSDKSTINTYRYRIETAIGMTYPLHLKNDYDIEVAYLECGSTKIMAGSRNSKALKLAWVHCDLKKLMPNPKSFAHKTKSIYKKFDIVVPVSKAGEQSFTDLYGTEIRTEIVYNTVDCEEILEKSKLPTKDMSVLEESPLVVSLGRLSEPKHYIRLLKAHKRLMEEGIVHNLLILGEGPDRDKLESYVRKFHLEETVSMPGFVDNPYPYMKKADVLACSSIYECFSTFVTEGLILGKPIVTTRVSGMDELLGESQYGLITDNEDEAFYEGLKRMLTNEKTRNYYAYQSEVRGKTFSTEKLVRETEEFLIRECKMKGIQC